MLGFLAADLALNLNSTLDTVRSPTPMDQAFSPLACRWTLFLGPWPQAGMERAFGPPNCGADGHFLRWPLAR